MMTRTEKYKQYRKQIEEENAEYNRRLTEIIFDDWFDNPLGQIEKFMESLSSQQLEQSIEWGREHYVSELH